MKVIILFLTFICVSIYLQAQNVEDESYFDSQDTIFLPHYGQNEILDSLLNITMGKQTFLNSSDIGIIEDVTPFHIPVKIWIYHNDGGIGDNDALSIADANRLFDEVNNHYANSNTGIQFYLKCQIEHVNSTQFNTIDDNDEYMDMITTYHEPKAHNWHLIRESNAGWSGKARFPWKKHNLRFAAVYGGLLSNNEIITTVHEIGHTLGLLHTHENLRGSGNYNGDASNCYQESVSRSKKQGAGCVSTIGKKKCDINGDALCDTEAAPNTSDNKFMALDNSVDCNYVGGGTDNWDDDWNPPTINYMSYLEYRACRSEFTLGQIGVMHAYIILSMAEQTYPLPGIEFIPWYNLHSISLSGTVNSGENESYTIPQMIEVANESNSYTINSGATINLYAGENIKLKPGFHAKPGASFNAKAGAVTNCDEVFTNYPALYTNRGAELQTLSQDSYSQAYTLLQDALDRNNDKSSNDTKTEEEYQNKAEHLAITIYPNPANTHINIQMPDVPKQQIQYRLYNTQGLLLSEVRSSEPQVQIPVSHFPEGIYILKIAGNSINKSRKIVLKR
jgi:hypothetical protein